jgi:anhydro-N-acetylmuramic acid kinase
MKLQILLLPCFYPINMILNREYAMNVKLLERLSRKRTKLIIGLMSGTSADGIDAALVEVTGWGTSTKLRPLAFETYPYPGKYKQYLLKNSNASTARIDDITRLNTLVAMMFADAARKIATKGGKRLGDVDLIGSHGQTIHHLPDAQRLFGKQVRGSLQVGDPSMVAKLTGVVTVGDFRSADIAAGGTGAPLVPYFDYVLFKSSRHNRALLNIGGISNITILPKRCTVDKVVAFDCGPGSMIIDDRMHRLYRRPFDVGGAIAMKGMIVPELLRRLMRHPYFLVRPPKSTGREMFGEEFIGGILRDFRGVRRNDLITTITEFTALSIYDAYRRFVQKNTRVEEILVGGGGVHNQYLMGALKRYFAESTIAPMESVGMMSDAKEALCFAVLANESIVGNPSNVPGATGARRRTTLGAICFP